MAKNPAAPTTVGVYARISDARDGDTEGTERQVALCRAHAETHGMTIVGLYIDNNRSAYKPGGKRPEYDRLLGDLDARMFDAVLVVATDRLYRQMRDLEGLVERLGGDRHGKPVYTVRSGDVDLSTADGRLNARLLGAVAMHSSEKQGERISDAALDRARRGRFNGGGRRFGYNASMTELVEDEAEGLRWAYLYVASGGSIGAAARELRKRGLTGTQGGPMSRVLVSEMLRRPANGGLVAYKGEILDGVQSLAPAIVDKELWERTNLILRDPTRAPAKGRYPKSLLAGILICGKCGERLYFRTYKDDLKRRTAYNCNRNGCTKRSSVMLDEAVTGTVIEWLRERKAVIVKPKKYAKGDETLPAQADALRRELEEIQLWHSAGEINASEWKRLRDATRARLDIVVARMETLTPTRTPGLDALLKSARPEDAFAEMVVEDKRVIIKELVDGIVLPRITRWGFKPGDPLGLTYQWKDLDS